MCLLARPARDLQAHLVCRLDAFGVASGIAAVRNGISAGSLADRPAFSARAFGLGTAHRVSRQHLI